MIDHKQGGLLSFVVGELKARRGQWPKIAEDTGIPYFTLSKIASGAIRDPGVTKVETLADYFRGSDQAA